MAIDSDITKRRNKHKLTLDTVIKKEMIELNFSEHIWLLKEINGVKKFM